MDVKKRLFIISNRLPLQVTKENNEVVMHPSSGGLVSAVNSYLEYETQKNANQFSEQFWIGVPGCSQATWSQAKTEPEADYTYLPVFVNNQVYNSYYNGMSNSVIWPLFHYFPTYAEYHTRFYINYIKANQEFFEVIARSVREGDTLWIHDYHLMPLAGMVREKFPNITIGFFLHVPFPSYELFRLMPKKWQAGILEGMLGADLIGFHTIDYASHFLKTVQMTLNIESERSVLKYRNRLVKTDVFPISIDFEKFHHAYDDKEVADKRAFYRGQFPGKKIIFSVDRLDYTKCVLCRLKGYQRFFEIYPEYIEKVVFILNIIPSRDNIPSYSIRKKEIDEFIGSFNARIGNIQWKPVSYQYTHLQFPELVALYTACDLALITPLRDGMNLVAKEFVASRKDRRGVLLLSEMAGAARELTDALMINPNDADGIAERIQEALEMDTLQQETRMAAMQQRLEQYNVNVWAEDFLTQLSLVKEQQKEYEFYFLDGAAKRNLVEKYRAGAKRLILLDYDGTLVPFSSLPGKSSPGAPLLHVLTKLAENSKNEVFIISGRDSITLEKWLGHLPINLIAEHGAKRRFTNCEWQSEFVAENEENWKPIIRSVMDTYVKRCVHTFVETKEYSMVWHYRNADPEQAKLRSAELFSELAGYSNHLNLQVVKGNKIIETRMKGMDKGIITRKLLKDQDYDFIIACGDDNTDEDMFQVLAGYDQAYTLKIGDVASYARYNLYTPQMTLSLLELLANVEQA